MKRSFLLSGSDSSKTVVFAGGICNVVGTDGKLVRSVGRDPLHEALEAREIPYFDPQIDPATHGRDYDYAIDGPGEQSARAAAKVTVYELGTGTLAAVTALEIIQDAVAGKSVVVWFNGEKDAKGNLVFAPQGDMATENPSAAAHLKEYVKAGGNIRKNLRGFLSRFANVAICATLEEALEAIDAKV